MSDEAGPAFPVVFTIHAGSNDITGAIAESDSQHIYTGISIRDYFAGQAMIGLAFCMDSRERGTVGIAKIAYELADSMLAERAK